MTVHRLLIALARGVAVLILAIGNVHAYNVMNDEEFSSCKRQYEATKKLSEYCDTLWKKIEQKIESDIGNASETFKCKGLINKQRQARCADREASYVECKKNNSSHCDAYIELNKLAHSAEDTDGRARNPANREKLRKHEANARAEGKKLVLGALKDPASARFKNLRPTVGGGYLCGEVNARNGFGGYVGFARFYVSMPTGDVQIEDKDSDYWSRQMLEEICQEP